MILYPESFYKALDLDIDSRTNVELAVMPPPTKVPVADDEFHVRCLLTAMPSLARNSSIHRTIT